MAKVIIQQEWLTQLVRARNPDLEPEFAFASAINWVRGLAVLCVEATNVSEQYVRGRVRPLLNNIGPLSVQELTPSRLCLCLAPLYMASNFANALDKIRRTVSGDPVWSVLSNAMVSWYYALYWLAHALVGAMDGVEPDTHAKLHKMLNDSHRLRVLPPPFGLRAVWGTAWNRPALEPATWLKDATFLRQPPTDPDEARAAVGAYLSGTWAWYGERLMSLIKRKEKLPHFRTGSARKIRDTALQALTVNFFHAIYRYRTKANYRDSIFSSYGAQFTGRPDSFLSDLITVYEALSLSVDSLVCCRIGITAYRDYVGDLQKFQRDPQAKYPAKFQGPAVLAGMA